jgi:hypothetical protein
MFIKVTELNTGNTLLVNTNNIYYMAEYEGEVRICYAYSDLWISESIDEIERMLKGADDE